MKNRVHGSFRRIAKFVLLVGLAAGWAGFAPRHALAKFPPHKNGNPNPTVLPINSSPYGKTYAQWSAVWWQYVGTAGTRSERPDTVP